MPIRAQGSGCNGKRRACGGADHKKLRASIRKEAGEADVLSWWRGRKRVGETCDCKRIGKIIERAVAPGSIQLQENGAIKWRRAVKLNVILAFENVVKDSKSCAHAGLAVAENVPRESEPRCPIVLVRKVHSRRRIRVAREHEANGRVHEALRLFSGDDGVCAAQEV